MVAVKKLFDWFKKSDSMVLKVLPCAWGVALFMGGAESFREGFSLDSVMTFLLFLFLGVIFWAVSVALPWFVQDREGKDKPLASNGLLLVVEAFSLVGLTMWVAGYV